MKDKANMNEMTKKYKEEMLRIYNSTNKTQQKMEDLKAKQMSVSKAQKPVIPENKVEVQAPENPMQNSTEMQKFTSPDDILARETNGKSSSAQDLSQGNYNLAENYKLGEADEILSRLVNSGISDDFPEKIQDETEDDSYGYLEVTVKSANNAYPLENATVVISKKGKDALVLEYAQLTDENGMIAPVKLKAPDKELSEFPQDEFSPFSTYQVLVYLEGYYPIIKKDVSIFPDTKSVQPFSLIPIAK